MPTKTDSVTHDEWVEARKALLIEEKAFMRARDELSRRIREMPAEEITKPYTFEGTNGPVALAELFGPKDQLVIYHFMLGPDWKEGCPGAAAGPVRGSKPSAGARTSSVGSPSAPRAGTIAGPSTRGVAQLGRALRSGRRGRRFKSCHPDFLADAWASGTYE